VPGACEVVTGTLALAAHHPGAPGEAVTAGAASRPCRV